MFEKGWENDLLIELIHTARKYGSNIFTFAGARVSFPDISREDYVKTWVGRFLKHQTLLRDFCDYINQEKSIEKIADHNHIFEVILLPDDSFVTKTMLNANALADAMKEVYPRHRRKSVDEDKLPPVITNSRAAGILNITKASIGKAVNRNRLERAGRGRVTTKSVLEYKKRP